jgi:hypothetical protein
MTVDYTTLEQEILQLIQNTTALQQTFQNQFATWDSEIQDKLTQIDTQFQSILNNIGQALQKNIYVDQINGDDSNPGTSDAPVKTLKQAFSMIPVKGEAGIYLLNDYTWTPDEGFICFGGRSVRVFIQGHSLTLDAQNVGKDVFVFSPGCGLTGGDYSMLLIDMGNGQLNIRGVDDSTWFAMVTGAGQFTRLRLAAGTVNGDSQSTNWRLVSFQAWQFFQVELNLLTINYAHSAVLDFAVTNMILTSYGSKFYSDNGTTAVTLADIISGIVKDSNGVPRNILCNRVL